MADVADRFSEVYPWEIDVLLNYCNIDKDILQKVGYGNGSVFATVLYIASQCPKLRLLGSSLEEEMEIREWAEFYCSKLRPPVQWHASSNIDQFSASLEKLNSHLSDRCYLSGTVNFSIADILIYYGLYRHMVDSSFSSKMTHIHVSRWFDQMQHSLRVKPFTWQWVSFPKT